MDNGVILAAKWDSHALHERARFELVIELSGNPIDSIMGESDSLGQGVLFDGAVTNISPARVSTLTISRLARAIYARNERNSAGADIDFGFW